MFRNPHDEQIPKLLLGFKFDEDFTEKMCKNCCRKVKAVYCIDFYAIWNSFPNFFPHFLKLSNTYSCLPAHPKTPYWSVVKTGLILYSAVSECIKFFSCFLHKFLAKLDSQWKFWNLLVMRFWLRYLRLTTASPKAWHSHCWCYQTNNISFKKVYLTICNYSFFQMF